MDPRTFDTMIRRLSGALSRRSLVGGALGASVLATVGLGDKQALARRKRVGSEACIPTGKKCPSKKPRGKKGKKLGCDKCCQGEVVTVTNAKGKPVKKCACKPLDSACTPDNSQQCCSGVCGDGKCLAAVCLELGAECVDAEECCSGACQSQAPQSPELCCLDAGAACDVEAVDQCCVGLFCVGPEGATCQQP